VLRDWLKGTEEGAAARIRDVVRQGFIEGQTTSQIVRTLRGSAANQFKDGVLEVSRRGAEAMVRTALTHTANVAAQETYKALGVAEWRFVATLDNRTTLICASLHGRVFPVGEGPQPPRHFNCRSTSIAVVDAIPGVAPMPFPSYEEWLRNSRLQCRTTSWGRLARPFFVPAS
jgi:SPP1 gp7 family putative phage head morphogenesis protein